MQYVMPLSQLLLYFSDISQKVLLVTYVEQLVPFFLSCMCGSLVSKANCYIISLFCAFLIDISEEENCHQA